MDSDSQARHTQLLELQTELRSLIETSADASKPVDLDQPIGRLSRMDAIQQQNMIQASRRSAELRLQQVAAALRRLGADEYGECLSCGDAIGAPRLAARPEAPFCISCQSKREQR
jgi:DnaK suppressor protein